MSSSMEAAEHKLHEELQRDPNSAFVAHLKRNIEELKAKEERVRGEQLRDDKGTPSACSRQ